MEKEVLELVQELPNWRESKFLLAVSGGVDSMVMVSIFKELNLDFCVAHCNFQLRGKDSEMDENLVKSWCENNQKLVFVKKFEVEKFKKENKGSTQMAARDLRYAWFNELKIENNLDYIVTAHHLDDDIETVFLNMARGTGISGISGMKMIAGSLFRPFLSCAKSDFLAYAKQNQIEYREDRSNEDTHYKRNKLRQDILPQFLELNPSFGQTMKKNLTHLKAVESFYQKSMNKVKNSLLESASQDELKISITRFNHLENKELVLFEILSDFGFNETQFTDVISVLKIENSVGKQFFSLSHRLLVDRDYLLITKKKNILEEDLIINKPEKTVTSLHKLSFKKLLMSEFELRANSQFAFLDADKIKFPLVYRKWKQGDRFVPFGMKGSKKISDYLIDDKISLVEKEKTYLLESEGNICWVIGKRIDERFKVSKKTKNVLQIKLED